jgi:hypothetical protein
MSLSLSGILLPDLVLSDDFGWTGIVGSSERSLGGRPIVFEAAISGRPLDLYGGPDFGWITKSTLAQLVSLASVPFQSFTLVYEGASYNVRFRHEDSPAISADPLIPRPNSEDTDYYNNVLIKLKEASSKVSLTVTTTTATASTTTSGSTTTTTSP